MDIPFFGFGFYIAYCTCFKGKEAQVKVSILGEVYGFNSGFADSGVLHLITGAVTVHFYFVPLAFRCIASFKGHQVNLVFRGGS
ncbi:hypothetical protein D9M68_993110 [compost metagenome]